MNGRGVLLRGGVVETTEADVKVHAPTPHAGSQALVTNPTTHALLIPKERDGDQAQTCMRCGGGYIAVEVRFPGEDGHEIRICRDCILSRPVGKPFVIDMQLVD